MPPSTANSSCPSCLKVFSSSANVRRHQEQEPICRIHRERAHQKALKAAREKRQALKLNTPLPVESDNCNAYPEEWTDLEHGYAVLDTSTPSDVDDPDAIAPPRHPPTLPKSRQSEITEEETNSDISAGDSSQQPQSNPTDTLNSCGPWYQQIPYRSQKAGQPISLRQGKTAFEKIEDSQVLKYGEVLGPFRDEEEWELAKWLIKNVGHTQADSFLKLPIVRFCST